MDPLQTLESHVAASVETFAAVLATLLFLDVFEAYSAYNVTFHHLLKHLTLGLKLRVAVHDGMM